MYMKWVSNDSLVNTLGIYFKVTNVFISSYSQHPVIFLGLNWDQTSVPSQLTLPKMMYIIIANFFVLNSGGKSMEI